MPSLNTAPVRHIYLALTAALLCITLLGCEVEEEIQLSSNGSGTYRVKILVEKELGEALPQIRQECQQKGLRIVKEGETTDRKFLLAERGFNRIDDLNDNTHTYTFSSLQATPTTANYELSATLRRPEMQTFSRTLRIVMPTGIKTATQGRVSGKSVEWDCSSGGTLYVVASGFSLPLTKKQQTLMLGIILFGIAAIVAIRLKRRPSSHRCHKCSAPVAEGAKYCPACGAGLPEPGTGAK